MPFEETHVMDQRVRFVQEAQCSLRSLAELCRRYEISRKTAYKWINRYLEQGPDGLWDRSHAPQRSPHRTSDEVEQAIAQIRQVLGAAPSIIVNSAGQFFLAPVEQTTAAEFD